MSAEISISFGQVRALDGVNISIEPPHRGAAGAQRQRQDDADEAGERAADALGRRAAHKRVGAGQEHAGHCVIPPERTCIPLWMSGQLLDFYRDFYTDFRRDAAEKMFGRLGIPLKQKVKQMSKGTREKAQLILVMSRRAGLYLLDEPIGGVDPAARDFILDTVISNYNPEAAVVISTHIISDVEKVLDEVYFINRGEIVLHDSVDAIREEKGMSVDALFREVFRC